MTPYEMSKIVHRELSHLTPRLSAALNRALVDIGEGSILVGLGPGTHCNDRVSFQEVERVDISRTEPAQVLAKIHEILGMVEQNSAWRVLVDKGPAAAAGIMELHYALYREPGGS